MILHLKKEFVSKILSSLGEEMEMDSESQIDAVTAMSGSGPAYFYFLTEPDIVV